MLNVKNLAKLLTEIFTRDNENFSPELIAKEIKDREIEILENVDNRLAAPNWRDNCALGPEALIGYKVNKDVAFVGEDMKEPECVVIGNSSQCTHDNSVVIGNNQKSDRPGQIKIGNSDISVSRDITDEEFEEILATFKSVHEFLPSKQQGPTGLGYDVLYKLK